MGLKRNFRVWRGNSEGEGALKDYEVDVLEGGGWREPRGAAVGAQTRVPVT